MLIIVNQKLCFIFQSYEFQILLIGMFFVYLKLVNSNFEFELKKQVMFLNNLNRVNEIWKSFSSLQVSPYIFRIVCGKEMTCGYSTFRSFPIEACL